MKRTGQSGKTAAELMAELNADPEFVARRRQQEEAQLAKATERRLAEEPLVEDLRRLGLEIKSVWDLVNTAAPYPEAIPVLLDHLQRPYPERVREGIARALAVPEAKIGWGILLDAFHRESDQTTVGVKWSLGLALAAAANDDVLDDVITLLRDTRLGGNRTALLPALLRSSSPSAREVLGEMGKDPELAGEVRRILRIGERQKRNESD